MVEARTQGAFVANQLRARLRTLSSGRAACPGGTADVSSSPPAVRLGLRRRDQLEQPLERARVQLAAVAGQGGEERELALLLRLLLVLHGTVGLRGPA